MTDYRNYKRVVSVSSFEDNSKRIMLFLECGHYAYRYSKTAPSKVKCEECDQGFLPKGNPPPTKGKRGPKHKPPEQHHTPRLYKHAPDVIAILETIPKKHRARWVDNAIRSYNTQETGKEGTQKPN